MTKLNVGVIGTGYWGRKLVDEFSNIEDASIEAISDLSQDNLKFCVDRFKVKKTLTDFHELLAIPEIKAVAVATPNATHYQICKEALEAGKHVLVEKPITLNSKQGWELVKLAEERKLVLSVGHIFRFNNAISEVKRLIKERFFGKIFLMDLTWTNLEKPFSDRDVIFDLAPHMFDMMNYLLEDWPIEVCATGTMHRIEVIETAVMHTKFKDGLMASATLSWVIPKKTRQLAIIGESRSMFVDAVGQDITVFESGYTYKLGVDRNNTIKDELMHFIESIHNPLSETRNSGAIGVKTIELIEATKQSIAQKKCMPVLSK
ncbi:MAG: Gfo/Idh/MocA family oxidoreductase [Thermoplasmata archaeon]|nr:Gfo/Idh/MocA family oxidoreductase [Thermoplasmata archaeon]